MSTQETYPQILHELDGLRQQWRQQKVLEGTLLSIAAVAIALLGGVAIDALLHPSPLGRIALLALLLWTTAIVGVLTWIVRRWMEDCRDDFFAAMVERATRSSTTGLSTDCNWGAARISDRRG